jgi:phospholipid transport system substrate-binding protein
MRRAILLVSGLLSLILVANPAGAQAAPDRIVRDNTEHIIKLIKTNREAYKADSRKLYAMVNEIVMKHFDFRAMSRLVLGRSWREANEDQRSKFTQEFRDLLIRTYSTVLLKYNNEEIVYLPYKPASGEKTTSVKVEIKLGGGASPVPIQYDFYLTDSSWRVYDVVVDGVSLVTNYRAAYAEQIKNDGLDKLIATLAKGNREGTPVEPALKLNKSGAVK